MVRLVRVQWAFYKFGTPSCRREVDTFSWARFSMIGNLEWVYPQLVEGIGMKLRHTFFVIPLVLLAASNLAARNSPDPTRTRLTYLSRLAALNQDDFEWLSARAESADREAQFWLGSMYEQGQVVEKNAEQAVVWLLKSAEQGYAPAQRALGMMY
jgi:TPR repeat protein